MKPESFKPSKQYVVTAKATSKKITPEQIWELWSDVNNWPNWDKGLESCKLESKFEVGTKFSLKPQGAPAALTTELLEVEKNKLFKDKTVMPLGTIFASHSIEVDEDKQVTVTHKIEALIYEDKKEIFEKSLLAKWEAGLPKSVTNLVSLAESGKKKLDPEPILSMS